MTKIITIILSTLIYSNCLASEYHIGNGQHYPTIGAFPWTTLVAGDIVYIHPGIYHEFIYVSSALKGTQSKPIRIVGITDGEGNKPILDASNATISSNFDAYGAPVYHELLGIVTFGTRATGYVYPGDAPQWVSVENIKIQNYKDVTVTDHTSTVHTNRSGECVYIQAAQNVTLDNVTVTGCDDGIFGKDNGPPVQNITVKNSYIYNNGVVGNYLNHNVYTEVDGITFEGNHFGPLISGSPGNNVKDRSAGFIFRYNYLEGGAHLLDLVECQDNCTNHTTKETWNDSFVYGNAFYSGPNDASQLFHLGTGDGGASTTTWRKNLYFYNNTVLVKKDQADSYYVNIFQLFSSGQSVYVDNNIFYFIPNATSTVPNILLQYDSSDHPSADGNMYFGKNWINSGWYVTRPDTKPSGTISGTSNLFSTGNPNLSSNTDFHLLPGSAAINASSTLPNIILSGNAFGISLVPYYQYESQKTTPRLNISDIGAYAYSSSSNKPKIISIK